MLHLSSVFLARSVCCILVFVIGVAAPASAQPPISAELAALKVKILDSGARIDQLRKDQEAQIVEFKKSRESSYYGVSSKNFLVGAVGESFSKSVLRRAEELRKTDRVAVARPRNARGKRIRDDSRGAIRREG